jgi:hypothetical protein
MHAKKYRQTDLEQLVRTCRRAFDHLEYLLRPGRGLLVKASVNGAVGGDGWWALCSRQCTHSRSPAVDVLSKALRNLSLTAIDKSMRQPDKCVFFAPIRWLLALFSEQVIPLSTRRCSLAT